MKKIQNRLLCWGILICILAVSCASTSCKKRSSPNLSFRSQALSLRLEGNQYGVDLTCDISCENGRLVRLTYHAPDSMKGLVLTPLENGKIRVEKNGIFSVFSQESQALSGLLLPARVLLFSEESVRSLQKISTGYLLTLEQSDLDAPITLTLNENGIPSAVSGSDFSFRISNAADSTHLTP